MANRTKLRRAKLLCAVSAGALSALAAPAFAQSQPSDAGPVVGEVVVSNPAPQPGSIPWLLLRAKSHSGSGTLASVDYIARIRTEGGLAPADGCDAAHSRAERSVAYSASYVFFSQP